MKPTHNFISLRRDLLHIVLLVIVFLLLLFTMTAGAQHIHLSGGAAVQTSTGTSLKADSLQIDAANTLRLAPLSVLELSGNFFNGGTLNAEMGSLVNFSGAAQQLTGVFVGASSFSNLTKSDGGTLFVQSSVTVRDTLGLLNGVINSASGVLTLDSLSAFSGGGLSSFVDGQVAIVFRSSATNIARTFPLGKLAGNYSGRIYQPAYLPLTLAFSSTAGTSTFTTNLINAEAPNPASLSGGLARVSTVRHWSLAHSGGTYSNAIATLTWNTDDGIAPQNPPISLRVAQSASGTWQSLGNGGTTGSAATDGTIVSATPAITLLGDYLAFATVNVADNPLPVVLQNFTAVSQPDGIKLAWQTASEKDSRGFIIEKQSSSLHAADSGWTRIAGYDAVKSLVAQNSPNGAAYTFSDAADMTEGETFTYRLSEVSLSGFTAVLRELAATSRFNTGIKTYDLSQNYPNPFNPATTIRYQLPAKSAVNLAVYNLIGQKVMQVLNLEQEKGRYAITLDGRNFSSGVYFYRLVARSSNAQTNGSTQNFIQTKKMILVK
ncbi:MAG: T9SS type A sorting domain-containing protein [Rhizobacter sp.]|nr:T9SS type A sorting domain-containing protein [Chlorobiales bacterium]